VAGFATRPSFAGSAGGGAAIDHELTSALDHLMGAGQIVENDPMFRMP
jgi:hypothetical protein